MTSNRTKLTMWGRWVATFIGFPLAGVAARLVVGDIDATTAAVVGGIVGGAVLGTVQAFVGGIDSADRLRWIAATAVGFGVGLGIGATAIDFDTDPASLAVMGAFCGAGVGLAQAASIPMRGLDRALWALATPALWAGGWLLTSQVIVDADSQHAVFGSSGALAASAVAGVLFAFRQRLPRTQTTLAGTSFEAPVAR